MSPAEEINHAADLLVERGTRVEVLTADLLRSCVAEWEELESHNLQASAAGMPVDAADEFMDDALALARHINKES